MHHGVFTLYLDIKNEIESNTYMYNAAAVCMWTKKMFFTLNVTENLKNAVPERVKDKPNYKYIKPFSLKGDMPLFYQDDQPLQVS